MTSFMPAGRSEAPTAPRQQLPRVDLKISLRPARPLWRAARARDCRDEPTLYLTPSGRMDGTVSGGGAASTRAYSSAKSAMVPAAASMSSISMNSP